MIVTRPTPATLTGEALAERIARIKAHMNALGVIRHYTEVEWAAEPATSGHGVKRKKTQTSPHPRAHFPLNNKLQCRLVPILSDNPYFSHSSYLSYMS